MASGAPREPTVRHHVARDTLGLVISWLADRWLDESRRPAPDTELIVYLRFETERLTRLQQDLRVSDHDAVEQVIDQYSPLVQALLGPED